MMILSKKPSKIAQILLISEEINDNYKKVRQNVLTDERLCL